jgi:hypothetical protein
MREETVDQREETNEATKPERTKQDEDESTTEWKR